MIQQPDGQEFEKLYTFCSSFFFVCFVLCVLFYFHNFVFCFVLLEGLFEQLL